MALCPKCIIEGVAQGSGFMPAADRFRLELTFRPDSDGEVEGVRDLVFEGEIVDGRLPTEGFTARGLLVGNFDVDFGRQREAPAQVEAFARNDSLALVQLVVRDASDRVTFFANLEPANGDAADLAGVGFLGWPDETAASA